MIKDHNQALERLIWRFSECDHIWVNDKDINAINKLVEFVNKTKEDNFQSNIFFAKLYAYTLGHLLEKYNTTIDHPIIHKEIHLILGSSFDNIIYNITAELNFRYKYRIIEAAGCNTNKHPLQMSFNEKKAILSKLKRLLKTKEYRNQFYSDTWTNKEIELGIKNQINNFLYGI